MGQWYNWQLHLHYHHVWWVVLHLKRVTRIMFSPHSKYSKIGSCVNCTFIWKENFPMTQGYQKSFQQQRTCFVTYSQASIAEFNYKHWPKWLHRQVPVVVKCSTPSSADHLRTDLCGDCSMQVATTAHVTVRDVGRLLWGESFIFLYINTHLH